MFESEERRIVERIKDFIKDGEPTYHSYIMLRDGRILTIADYRDMVDSGKINPMDAYVYIGIDWISSETIFHFPFLGWYGDIFYAYLSELGFYYWFFAIPPATGLKYIAYAVRYENYLAIEVVNLYTAVSNTNLRKIVVEVLGSKLIRGKKEVTVDEYNKIYNMFISQKLFAGHNFDEARNIINEYYDKGKQSLTKEVARIAMDYGSIFQPYRVCYETRTWKEINCLSINLD